MDQNLSLVLKQLKSRVWKVIRRYLPHTPAPFAQMVSDYPKRQGKYLRPALLLLAYNMFGKQDARADLMAAALQTSEDWLLIHDDAEDHGERRRQLPSLNVLHGEELAVNAGDALHLLMWRML